MANRKMTLLKTKLAQSVSLSISSKTKSLGMAAALLLSSSTASALGLGALEVVSNLDQPLSGTIELRVTAGDDLDTLTAVIASREDFESLGIDYPSYLKDFSLLLDTLGDERLLRVTSNNIIIKEPFIHFLVRVEWSGGSFLREYTALIDPPIYAAEVASSIVEPKKVGTDQTYQTDSVETPDVIAEDLPAVEEAVVSEEPLIEDNFYNDDATSEGSSSQPTDARYGPVESGESLSLIAQDLQRQFPDLSIYQIMKVLFEENQGSFIGANINGLIKGSILNIGDLEAIRSVDVAESKVFYRQQIDEWNPQLLRPSVDDSINVGQDNYNFEDESSSISDSNVADNSDSQDSFQVGASTESNDYVSSDQGDSREGEVLALRQEVATLQSSIASSVLEKQELNERISLLEGQLDNFNRLAELSIESAGLDEIESALAKQNELSDEADSLVDDAIEGITDTAEGTSAIDEFLVPVDESIDGAVEDVDTAIDSLIDEGTAGDDFLTDDEKSVLSDDTDFESVIEEAVEDTGVVTTTPVITTVSTSSQETSFLGKAKSLFFEGGLWKVLAGLGALLIAGVGLLFVRRRRADEEFEISMLSIESSSHSVGNSASTAHSHSASYTASIASEALADKETSFLTVYSDSDAVVQADEVDPVAEADVYIAYGRDEQAEEVLLDGVASHPDRIDIKQKLLSLYHKRQNVEGFERIAEELYSQRAALTGDVWQQVCEMGKEVAPSNPLFELSGDDLNAAIEANSEILLEGEGISEVPIEEDDSVVLEPVAEIAQSNDGDGLVDHLEDSLVDEHGDLDEALTIEDESEMVVGSLAEDDSIQLVDFDDGRSEVSDLNEVEIDALEFGDEISGSMDFSKVGDSEAVEVSLGDDSDDDLLDFNIEEIQGFDEDDDLDNSLGEAQEVSDLEIDADYDDARTQYELAKVFVDLGDEDGARKILDELVSNDKNSAEVLSDANALLDSINA